MDKTLKEHLEQAEREYLERVLSETHGRMAVAAGMAAYSASQLYLLCQKHKIYPTRFRKQRGFIGGIYGYLALAVAAAVVAGGCYLAGRSDGRALERAGWVDQQNADLRDANRALDEAHKKIREQEQAAAQRVAAVSTAYQKDLANANRAKDLALNSLRASGGGLRVAVTGCQADASGAPEAAPSAPGRDGREASGLLAEPDAAFLVSEASRADNIVAQLSACQAVVRADRGG